MHTCRRGIVIAAVLSAGCSGTIETPYKPGTGMASGSTGNTPGAGSGNSNSSGGKSNATGAGGSNNASGSTGNPGSGGNGTGATGTGATGAGAAGPTACSPGVPSTSQLPKLTNLQYENTVRDLFEISSAPTSSLA